MDSDDVLVGRLLSRREVLALLGAGGLALIVGCGDDDESPRATATGAATGEASGAATQAPGAGATSVPSCVVRPELTEGPYFVDEMLDRSDIRSDPTDGSVREGTPLDLAFQVSQISGGSCTPLAGATVDAWQCDALGVYSDVTDFAGGFDTVGQKFLRGFQVTDASGVARFTTIYPGWYQGRATHIHFKIRTDAGLEFTSQLFFDDALSDEIHAQGAYAGKGAAGRLENDADGIFQQSGGVLTLDLTPAGDGYAATFDIGLETG